mmetsp:Transcript_28414/g.74651  ORF Transcript_28414/g.74651 Transcript_28414/m.74651 type:complete len:489 (-) Transcript_28414:76-1542(-)
MPPNPGEAGVAPAAPHVARGCPAFEGGCPFKSPAHLAEDEARRAARRCPAFGDGCTFRNARSIADLEAMLTRIPESHKIGGKTFGSSSSLRAILQAIHTNALSTAEREGLGTCPVFQANGCPFKNVTSQGSPLVSELEYRTWSIFENLTDEEECDPPVGSKKSVRTADDAPPAVPTDGRRLSADLKVGTKKSHRAAENVQFVRNFLRGRVDRTLYKHLLLSLYHVYQALEDELRKNADHPIYSQIHFAAELERESSLEADLEFFLGEGWRDDEDVRAGPSECAQEYIDRIRAVGGEAPELLVAHAYTRYLGDLSGGQVLKRVAIKAMGLPDGGLGTAFYDFEAVPDAKAFKEAYRQRLDDTAVDVRTADRIVAEANLAFVLNMRVFEELDVLGCDADRVRPLAEVLATLEMPVVKEQKCPFAVRGGPNPHAGTATTAEPGAVVPTAQGGMGCPITAVPRAMLNPTVWRHPVTWLLLAVVAVMIATVWE